jgi:hypothetical protein
MIVRATSSCMYMRSKSVLDANAIIVHDIIDVILIITKVFFLPNLSRTYALRSPPNGQAMALIEARKKYSILC